MNKVPWGLNGIIHMGFGGKMNNPFDVILAKDRLYQLPMADIPFNKGITGV